MCRRKERCCQLETPVCDLTVWCDFIGARHASITRESSRAEREGSTHVGRHCFEHGASSHNGDDVKDFHANRCAFTFFFTHINELTQMHWKDLAGIKVELKELLMDIRSSMRKSSGEQILGWMVRCLEEGLPFVDLFHQEFSDRNLFLACSELFVPGVHGPTSNGGPGKRASSVVRLGLTQVMKVKTQNLLHTAMEQFECALAAGQVNIAGRVCRTLRFLGENTDMPMVRGRFSEAFRF